MPKNETILIILCILITAWAADQREGSAVEDRSILSKEAERDRTPRPPPTNIPTQNF
jgi:hypothetical protein